MIAQLTGTVRHLTTEKVVLEVGELVMQFRFLRAPQPIS